MRHKLTKFAAILLFAILAGTAQAQITIKSIENWKLFPKAEVNSTDTAVSTVGFDMSKWINATVPGTIFSSYVDQGLAKDPIYQNDQTATTDSSQNRPFWYRTEIDVPDLSGNKKLILNIDGINWKADIWVNGKFKGRLSYAFNRGKYDITDDVISNSKACIAVLILPCAHPGPVMAQTLNWGTKNGGVLGYDCPTFTASQHWNWIPTVRGRDIGIYDNIYITTINPVMVKNPTFKSSMALPDTSLAALTIKTFLNNYSSSECIGTLTASIDSISISQSCTLEAYEIKEVVFDTSKFQQLLFKSPKLWWPNGYGQQYLYDLKLKFESNDIVSDSLTLKVGIRQLSYNYSATNFSISCNGMKLLLFGGNWGMPEFMYRCTPAKYDQWVRMHKEMNFNMIRNWVGQTGHDAFYEACDKYGILIMDDFWLANPYDGPNPDSLMAFLRSARDKVTRNRNHASLAFYCGRNEGNPSESGSFNSPGIPGFSDSLKAITQAFDGTRFYVPNSAWEGLSGFGPYELKDPKWYFSNSGSGTFHTEMGVVAPMVYESMELALGKENLWPINNMWGVHDWTQDRDKIFERDLINHFGAASGIKDFLRKAQCLNYQDLQAFFETYQAQRGSGILLWMSHPAWTSLKCQTYDYFGDYTAGFFAAKKACERIHVLWNCNNNKIMVANNTKNKLENLLVKVWVYNIDGKEKYHNSSKVSVPANSTETAYMLEFPAEGLSNVNFVRLKLFNSDSTALLSENFYWRGQNYLNYKDLLRLREPKIEITDLGLGDYLVENTDTVTAFFIRLKMLDKDGNRILPVYYSNSYFTLFSGESQKVHAEFIGEGSLKADPFFGDPVLLTNIDEVNQVDNQITIKTINKVCQVSGLKSNMKYSFQFVDVQGHIILQSLSTKQETVRIDLQNVFKGVYICLVFKNGEEVASKKIILN